MNLIQEGKAQLKDIARLCNVSEATVSKALNAKAGVNLETQARVVSVARQYNYLPNRLVRAIQTGRSMMIGIAYNDFGDEFSGMIVNGILNRLLNNDYAGLIIPWDLSVHEGKHVLRNMAERRVDGILMLPPADIPSSAQIDELRTVRGPVVVIDQRWQGFPFGYVGSDNIRGAIDATEHLIGLGHRRIAVLHYSRVSSGRERMDGFRQAMSRHGVAVHDKWVKEIREAEKAWLGAYELARELLSQKERPTAIVCFNDLVAAHVLAAVTDMGMRVPQDVSVTGFADLSIAQHIRPRLTSVHQDPLSIGTHAAEMVLKRLKQHGDEKWQVEAECLLLPSRLVIRESTAIPNK